MSQNSFCFSSFVFGNYQKYIPYYIYSISKIYPTAFIKIFLEKSLQGNIKKVLEMFQKKGFVNFEVIEMQTSFDAYQVYKMKGSGAKTMIRWLFGKAYFTDFDYVYIGDIDIFFLPETISVLDFHIKQMHTLNLPFSNKVRLDKEGKLTERLTGLHFFKTEPYFNKIEPIINRVQNDKQFRDSYLKGLERNEHFLYKINMQAFNFNPEKVSKAKRPWHGLHLGITRGNKNVDISVIKDNSSLTLNEITKHLKVYAKDSLFKAIQKNVFVLEFAVILKELAISQPLSWKLQIYKQHTIYKLRAGKRGLKALIK